MAYYQVSGSHSGLFPCTSECSVVPPLSRGSSLLCVRPEIDGGVRTLWDLKTKRASRDMIRLHRLPIDWRGQRGGTLDHDIPSRFHRPAQREVSGHRSRQTKAQRTARLPMLSGSMVVSATPVFIRLGSESTRAWQGTGFLFRCPFGQDLVILSPKRDCAGRSRASFLSCSPQSVSIKSPLSA